MKRTAHPTLSHQIVATATLCGGTHGNELTGVRVLQRQQYLPPKTFTLDSVLANPEAVRQNRRYIDYDLNRCFGSATLENPHGTGYERQRAHLLNSLLGPKGSKHPARDLIIDMHTTTAALGSTVIIREDDLLARYLAAWAVQSIPELRVMSYLAEEPMDGEAPAGGAPGAADRPGDYPYLAEITPSGIEIEVGPVPQGVVRAETVLATERIINACTAALDAWNRDEPWDLPESLTIYRYIDAIDYPRGRSGELSAFVHPLRQDRDFVPLQPGDPLFLADDDSVLSYNGIAGLYPVFINEAAYYEKHAAMTLCEKREIPLLRTDW